MRIDDDETKKKISPDDLLNQEGAIPMWLVYYDGKAFTAQPTRLRAEVYASNFSRPTEIRGGIFIPISASKKTGVTPCE